MKQGPENESPLFKNIPCLLSICEFVSEKLGEVTSPSPKTMILTIDILKGMFYKGVKRNKVNNQFGCKGMPKCPTIVNNDMEDQMEW